MINADRHIYLWNPATRLSTKVLELDPRLGDYYTRGGLCFDFSKNVYKAVLILAHVSDHHDADPDYGYRLFIVASLKDKHWRKLEFPYDIDVNLVSDGITLQGRLHYRVRFKKSYCENYNDEDDFNDGNNKRHKSDSRNQVICFDPISEKFIMFPVPEPKSNQEENAIVDLGVLNECLCMTCLDDDKGGVEILVMKEYGVKESWTSLFFIRNLEINPPYGFAVPFSVTEIGEVALIINRR
ncbi:F-box protein CPR1-like, partial [Lycium ferocissimum]|uniref:F-box protein CPR1-like n=1 Tax=Lycium ferocissimum TaxID=112874 RepID=UPI0028151E71